MEDTPTPDQTLGALGRHCHRIPPYRDVHFYNGGID